MPTFHTLNLPSALANHLEAIGFHTLTTTQHESLPSILEGKSCQIKAKTGSGKTLAFGIQAITRLDPTKQTPQTLVIAPTRELVEQIASILRDLAKIYPNIKVLTLSGGVPIEPQYSSLQHGAHILVATPGRLCRHLKAGLHVKDLKLVVLDEADRMFEMGFEKDIDTIHSFLPTEYQLLFFSATYPEYLHVKATAMLTSPKRIFIEEESKTLQAYTLVSTDKPTSLHNLLRHYQPSKVLVFCNAKASCDALYETLQAQHLPCVTLHGDKEMKERTDALHCFIHGSHPLLIATELAARGLDIQDIPLIINYDVPRSPQSYVHRIGRTARKDNDGTAVTLVTTHDKDLLAAIEAQEGAMCPHPPLHVNENWHFSHLPVTFFIHGGKKHKLRKGDIVGALVKQAGLPNDALLHITLLDTRTYVSIASNFADQADQALKHTLIKKRKYKYWRFPA